MLSAILIFTAIGFAAAKCWLAIRPRLSHRLPVTVTVDAEHPKAVDIAGYLSEIAARLDERSERMRVKFSAPDGITLDLEPDGRLAVRVTGQRKCKLDLRHRWIADHPVPIALKGLVLYIDPVDANRFRVNDRIHQPIPLWTALPLTLAASAGIILISPALVGLSAGLTLGLWLKNGVLRFTARSGRR